MVYAINNDIDESPKRGLMSNLQSSSKPQHRSQPLGSAGSHEPAFDFKRYSEAQYNYENLTHLLFDKLLPREKKTLSELQIKCEDDLGPEIILNFKWLDAYRYNQKSIYYFMDLVQAIKERYHWGKYIAKPDEENKEIKPSGASVQDPFFDIELRSVNFSETLDLRMDTFAFQIRKAPYLFTLLNTILLDCKLSQERERNLLKYADTFMSQPLPHGLLPMETHRIIQNERLLPGITKVLQIAQDFPQLNINPEDLAKMRSHNASVLNQIM